MSDESVCKSSGAADEAIEAMERTVNEVLGARSVLLGWRAAEGKVVKSLRGEGMLAAARMLIEASAAAARAAAARAAIAVANEAHYAAEGLSGTGEDLRLIAESLEAHCTKVETEAWAIFREMSDEAEDRDGWGAL